jgi:hypothetical protein
MHSTALFYSTLAYETQPKELAKDEAPQCVSSRQERKPGTTARIRILIGAPQI